MKNWKELEKKIRFLVEKKNSSSFALILINCVQVLEELLLIANIRWLGMK